MTASQERALVDYSAIYCYPYSAGVDIDFPALFGNENPIIAEIGFGMGQATWQIAMANPEKNYICFEVHSPGVGKLLSEIVGHDIKNIRIVHNDAIEVFEKSIKPNSLDGLHIFYPDPWPKKRHQKRRLIRPGIVEILVSRLKKGGYLYFVTDIEDYAEWTLNILSQTPGLSNRYPSYAIRQEWRPVTKFEARASKNGRDAFELLFNKGNG